MNKEKQHIDHFYKHEAMDRVHMVAHMVEEFLSNHPVIMQDETLSQNVDKALDCLADCYMQIGKIEVVRKGKIF